MPTLFSFATAGVGLVLAAAPVMLQPRLLSPLLIALLLSSACDMAQSDPDDADIRDRNGADNAVLDLAAETQRSPLPAQLAQRLALAGPGAVIDLPSDQPAAQAAEQIEEEAPYLFRQTRARNGNSYQLAISSPSTTRPPRYQATMYILWNGSPGDQVRLAVVARSFEYPQGEQPHRRSHAVVTERLFVAAKAAAEVNRGKSGELVGTLSPVDLQEVRVAAVPEQLAELNWKAPIHPRGAVTLRLTAPIAFRAVPAKAR